jgi:glucan 1,3-beta-glucosidase
LYRYKYLTPLTALFARSDDSASSSAARDSTANTTSELLQTAGVGASFPDGYWLNDLSGKGYAAFNANPGAYKVFRNVKDYGAVGK